MIKNKVVHREEWIMIFHSFGRMIDALPIITMMIFVCGYAPM
jgi:hypothetical protein